MADTETVRILRIRGQTEGLTEMSAKLKDIKAAQEGVAQSSTALAVATETSAKRQLSSAGAWERLAQKYDSASRAQAMFERELRVANRAFDAGKASGEAYVRTVEQMKRAYEGMGAAARTAASIDQSSLNRTIGIKIDITGSARDSAAAMEAEFARLDQVAQMKAAQIGADFGRELSERLIAGTGKAARDSASVFATELDRLDNIAKLKAEQAGAEFGRALNASLIKGQGKSASESASVFVEQERAVQRLRVEFDQLSVAQERRAASEAQINKFAAAGLIGEQQRLTMIDAVTRRYEDTAAALARTQVPLGKYVTGVGLARNELINLSRQAQDVFVSLASGQSPLTVLIQQGTQIADVFAASRGSVMGFLGQIGPALLRLAGPIALVTTALTAMYAAFKVSGEQQTLSNSLLGAGRASGLTGGQLESLAQQSAESAQITVSNARLIGAEYVKLGQIANDNLPKLTLLTKNFAAATGQDMKGAAQEIAQALADPSRGAQGLSDKIGGLDSTTLRMIRTATEFNDKLRAQKLLMDELGRATSDAADQSMSKWDRLMKSMGLTFDKLKEGAAGAVLGPDRNDEIARARARIREIEQQLSSGRTAIGQDSGLRAEIGTLRQKLSTLESIDQKERETARSRAESSASNKRITDGETVALAAGNQGLAQRLKLYNEAIGQANTLEKSVEELTKQRNAIGVPDSSNRERFATLTQQIKEQSEALEAQKRKVVDLQSVQSGLTMEQERARRGTEIDLKASKDKTLADAQETAAMRARNEAFGTARTQAEEDLRVKQAQREATVRGTVALNEQSKTIQDGIAVTNAQTEAYRRGGVAAAEVARIRKEAEQQARTTGGDVEVIFRERLNKEIAEAKRGLAEKVALQRQETSAANAANAAAAAGNLSAKQRTDLEERLRVEREAYNKLLATGLVTEKEAAKLAKEQADSVSRGQNARTDAAATDYIYQQNQTLETLKKQIELVGRSRDARYEELEILKAQQFLQENGISQESERGRQILANAKLIGQQNREYEIQLKLQGQIRQAQEFAADSLKSFLDELLTGTEGINGALKSLGKGFLSASLDALISGKGPLAGITGLASSTKDGQGGILGLLTTGIQGLGKQVEKGAEKGTAVGASTAIAAANDNISWLGGISGKDLAGGITAIAGLAGAYGSGMQAGSYGQAAIGGALSGGMGGLALAGTSIGASLGGAAVLGPIGAAIGIGLAVYGQQQARKKAKEQREQEAQENYRQAQPEILKLGSQLRGEAQGTLLQQFEEAMAATRKLGDVAFFAGKYDEQAKLWADLATYKTRIYTEFAASYQGFVDALNAGVGPGGAFNTAKDSVKALGDQLKGFIANVDEVFGGAQSGEARAAAAAYALSTLNGSKELSNVAVRMEEIRGVGAGLQQVLTDLGMSATDAAAAIQGATTVALDRLKETFEDGLIRQTRDASGYGYISEVSDLLKEFATLQQDAAALGANGGLVTDYFRATAQEIVDGAQLTGTAFDDLIRQFPELNGYVEEFTGALKGAAREADIAARKLAYGDRLFNATNDNSTLEGQLLAFDRAANRQREEEMRKGGEAIADLEAALFAERFNIAKDWNQKEIDERKRAMEEASNFLAGITRRIREYLDGLRAGSNSPLSPEARLAAAQSQYAAQLTRAQGGDRDALNSITSYSNDLLEAAKAYYASSTGFQTIFAQIQSQLGALPDQLSAEQFIVNAIDASKTAMVDAVALMRTTLKTAVDSGSAAQIATALSTYFNKIDTNTSQTIDFNEMKSALGGMASDSALRSMFTRLDVDNSGSLDRLELLKTATEDVDDRLTITNQLAADLKALTTQVNTNVNASNNILSAVQSLNAAINSSTASAATSLAFQNASTTYILSMRDMMRAQNQNWGAQDQLGYTIPTYAQGGLVSGPGTGTSDSITARLSNGEFVMNRRATDFFGASMLGSMNDNLSMPAVPVPMMGGGGDMRAVVAELKALRAELAAHKAATVKATVAAAEHVGEEVKVVAAVQSDAAREMRNKAA